MDSNIFFRILGNDNLFVMDRHGDIYYKEDDDVESPWRHDPSVVTKIILGEYIVENYPKE